MSFFSKLLRAFLTLLSLFFFILQRPPTSTLFPYTTLFRSISFTIKVRFVFIVYCIGLYNIINIQAIIFRSEEHTSELQSRFDLVCRLLLEKKKLRLHWPAFIRHGVAHSGRLVYDSPALASV